MARLDHRRLRHLEGSRRAAPRRAEKIVTTQSKETRPGAKSSGPLFPFLILGGDDPSGIKIVGRVAQHVGAVATGRTPID